MECISPKYLHQRDITVPCGRCGFCLATKRSDWSQRLNVEWRHSLDSAFITLTYANPFLRFDNVQGIPKPQLVKADLQKWFKCVRKAGYRFRYFAVGEYGSTTYRPHYHVLLFGSVPEQVIRKTWGLGTVHIGKISQASVGYCCKYIINSKVSDMIGGRERPFAVMSRKAPDGGPGGIGYQYLSKAMREWHKSDRKNYMIVDGQKRHLPRYYKEKIFSKIDRVRIANRAQRDSLECLRAELLRLGKFHPNAMEYREEMMILANQRIRDKSKQKLII